MVRPLAALALALLALAACDNPKAPPEEQAAASQPVPYQNYSSPEEVAAAQQPDGERTAPSARGIPLELEGVQLGAAYQTEHDRREQEGQWRLQGIWADTAGGTGAWELRPQAGGALPAVTYFFDAGRCSGYCRRQRLTEAEHTRLVKNLANTFDPGQAEPPEWAHTDAIVSALPALGKRDSRVFWDDEARGELLIVQRQDATGDTLGLLYNLRQLAELGITYADLAAPFEFAK